MRSLKDIAKAIALLSLAGFALIGLLNGLGNATITNYDPGFRLVDGNAIVTAITNDNGAKAVAAQTANGTTQATATLLTQGANEFTTVASSGVAVLPVCAAGMRIFVANNGGQTLTVMTNVNEVSPIKINETAGATGVTQANGTNAFFWCTGAGQWYRISGT